MSVAHSRTGTNPVSPASGPASAYSARLAHAVALHRAGRTAEAKAGYAALLAVDPRHGWANYFLGALAEAEGDRELARSHLRAAAATADAAPHFHIALGNCELARGSADAAADAFQTAIAARPDFAAAYTGLCLAMKHLDRLDEAASAARQALLLRRGWQPGMVDPPGFIDPTEFAAMRQVNRVKLRHDIEQVEYLRRAGLAGAETDTVLRGLHSLQERYASLPDDTTLATLDDAALALTGHGYNRLHHLAEAPGLAGAALDASTAFADADMVFATSDPNVAVVDDALSPPALEALQRLLNDSTIWFEVKDHGGHLGAYFEEGLACGLVNQIAAELRLRLPRTLGGRRLAQVWAYKYQQNLGGTDLHGDVGAVSVNLWTTPDSANRDASSGGMEIYPVAAPENWDFRQMNIDRERLRQLVATWQCSPVQIPYRCNRIVVFAARLLHRTMPGKFAEGYRNRRTNMTFLFE